MFRGEFNRGLESAEMNLSPPTAMEGNPQMIDSWDEKDEAIWQQTLRDGQARIAAEAAAQSKKHAIDKMNKQIEEERPTHQEVIFQARRPDTLNQIAQPINRTEVLSRMQEVPQRRDVTLRILHKIQYGTIRAVNLRQLDKN